MFKVQFDLTFQRCGDSYKNLALSYWKMRKCRFKQLEHNESHVAKACVVWIDCVNDVDFVFECDTCACLIPYTDPYLYPCSFRKTKTTSLHELNFEHYCRPCSQQVWDKDLIRIHTGDFYNEFISIKIRQLLKRNNKELKSWVVPSHLSNLKVLFCDFSSQMQQRLYALKEGDVDGGSSDDGDDNSSDTDWQYNTYYSTDSFSDGEPDTSESSDISLEMDSFEEGSRSDGDLSDGDNDENLYLCNCPYD